MSSLPEEMYHEILLKLPVKSTLVCKCVCKNWYAIISNPNFVKTHHKLTIHKTSFSLLTSKFDINQSRNVICSISYDSTSSISSNEFHLYGIEIDMPLGCLDKDIKLIGFCNGLVCIWNPQKELFGLWNPDSKEYKELPKSPSKLVDQIHEYLFTCGFGYDYNTCGYKLICLYNFFDDCGTKVNVYMDVYMMEPDLWKSTLVRIPYDIDMDEYSGELANGYFHWLGKRFDSNFYCIISLDISNENFKELQLPEEPFVNDNCGMNLGVLKECLSVLAYGRSGKSAQVWVMQDYGIQESWTRHYIITFESLSYDWQLRPMWSFNSGEILFVRANSFLENLVLYDPKDGSVRKPNMHMENKIFTLPKAQNKIILGA